MCGKDIRCRDILGFSKKERPNRTDFGRVEEDEN